MGNRGCGDVSRGMSDSRGIRAWRPAPSSQRGGERRHIGRGDERVKRLQTAGLTSRAERWGARRTVIWVLVCATAGAAPHSSATAMSAIAIRLSMATGGEGSRASTPRWSAQNWVPKSQRPFFTFVFSWLGPGGTVIRADFSRGHSAGPVRIGQLRTSRLHN